MLKQGAPKEGPEQEASKQKPESLASPKQQMDALVTEKATANTIHLEIGTNLREGKFTPEEKAGIIRVFVQQSDERSALKVAKASGLPPAQIRTLFTDSLAEIKLWQWADYGTEPKPEIPEPTETLQPTYTDLAKRLAQEKIEQRSKLMNETTPEKAEQQAWLAANRLLNDKDNLLDQEKYPRSIIKHNLRFNVTKNLRNYLDAGTTHRNEVDLAKTESVQALLNYIDANELSELNVKELSKLASEVSAKLTLESRRARPTLLKELRDLPIIKASTEFIKSIRSSDPSPETGRSPYYSKRADVMDYAKTAYSDTDIPQRVAEKMGRIRTSSTIAHESFTSSPTYESAKNSGDPKEKSVEIATLSEPYYGMLYKKKYGDFNVETSLWTESDDVEDLQSRPTDEGHHITVTIPNLSRYQILPKPLHDPIPGTQVYFERNEDDYEVSSVDPKIDWINTRKVASTEAPKLHYDFSPDKPHSLPAKLTLEEYTKQVKPPSPELREYAASSLPEHAQLFLKGIEALPVADQIKLIEAYSKKYGFYDFDNGEVQTAKTSIKNWKEQMKFMQDRLTEVSLTEDTSGKLYAGVCTDFQTLTTAMLLSKGLKTKVGTGFLVDGTSIKSTDSHALSLVEVPTENGSVETFEVDGTPSAGTAGSEKALASLQRSAFAETLEQTKKLLSSELEATDESTTKGHGGETSQELMAPSHAENMISLTFSPAEKQQTKAVLDTIRFSGLLTLSEAQLTDPETTVWFSKSIEGASEAPKTAFSETDKSDQELLTSLAKFEGDIQNLKPKQRDRLKKLLHPILAGNLPPKITALFKGL